MTRRKRARRQLWLMPLLIVGGIVLNWLIGKPCELLGLPLYLNNFGTVFVSIFGGALPAAILGLLSNAIGVFTVPNRIYFGLIGVLLAITISLLNSKGVFKSIWKTLLSVLVMGIVFGTLNSILSWVLFGFEDSAALAPLAHKIYALGTLDKYPSLFFASIVIETADKLVTVGVVVLVYNLMSTERRERIEDALHFGDFRKMPATDRKKASLMTKVIVIIILSEILLGTIATVITYVLYQDIAVRNFTEKCSGVAESAALVVDPDKVDEYLALGRDAPGYNETEELLYGIKNSFPQIEYMYAYRVEEDGCHVIFDLEADNLQASQIGEVVEFDEEFKQYMDDLLAGKEIEPIITNDKYGWLLTVYKPVRNAEGQTVCYMAADIEMNEIIADQSIFIVKTVALFFSVSIIVVYITMELIKYGVIFPINRMANATERFALDTDERRTRSLERLRELNIRSGDELENLYSSLCKMATDSAEYIQKMKTQADIIVNMQSAIIWDFAEMVEARDKCTGDHIKTTSAYVEAIAKELQSEGKYADVLTDEYIEKIRQMAPLHDIGKIKISDLILNKPGRLTEEEFELMKTHTTEGRNILMASSSFSNADVYLKEAIEMATYHHERWDGKGYPSGLKGADIPLSARIMAVADVFDALVSRRSYKEPFSFEKATAIIKEESGSHFDPVVAEAFLNISKKAYEEIACAELQPA